MERYSVYPEYRSWENNWIRELPKSWQIAALKHLCLNFVKDGPHETPKFLDSGIPFLSVDGIQDNKLIFEGCRYISREDHKRYSMKCLPKKGDVLLGKAASVGKVAYVDTDMIFNVWSPLAVITAKSNHLGRYIYYCLQSKMLQAQCEVFSNSNTQKNLGMSTIDNLDFPYPSEFEAKCIANFLDHETAKIDTLIEKQQQLIKLLKEKRQAVISHAVTRGLNPQVPMKDSGVEWCDYIPEHWRIGKLGYFARVGNGATPSRENQSFWNGGTIGWLNSSKVNDVIITEAEQFITPLALAQTSVQPVKANDLVIAITGEGQTRGRVAICQLEATINQHLASIQIYDNSLRHEFLFLWLSANYERIRFESTGAGSTKGAITCGDIKSYPIVLAPLPEQKEIINYIELQNQRFSNLMAKAEDQVQLLKERRTALISAAVTGKIDVRNWQAPISQDQALEQTA